MGLNKEGSQLSLFLKNSFYTISLTLLTLLLPLSFLLLSKLTSSSTSSIPPPLPTILRSLVSLLSLSSLLYSLSGHLLRPHIAIAWLFLCTFQVCVSLGIEMTVTGSVKPLATDRNTSHMFLIERAVFFLGLYETMLHWSRMFVGPVVDDTVYGAETDESRVDRLAMGTAFGVLWLWMLRDGIEPMVLAAGREGLVGAMSGWDGFVLWFVGYSTVVIGILRILQVIFWMGKLFFNSVSCGEVADVSVCSVAGDDQV